MTDAGSVQFAGAADSKIVFLGPPNRLQGTIRLLNPTDEKLTLKGSGVTADALLGPARLPLREVSFGARLNPGEQANVRSTLSLDPQTPPGTYDLQMNIGGKTVQATAHVTDVIDFRIQPEQITILAENELRYDREFVMENAGNVPLPISERCSAPLLDSVDLLTSMLMGLHKASKQDAKAMLQSLLEECGDKDAGTLVMIRERIVLGPGEKIRIKAQFQLPSELRPQKHYQASLQLYNAGLSVDVYTTGNTESENSQRVQEGR